MKSSDTESKIVHFEAVGGRRCDGFEIGVRDEWDACMLFDFLCLKLEKIT